MIFFELVSNDTSSPFNAAVIGYFDLLTFSLITALTFPKDNVSSIQISTLYTCVLFIIFYSVSSPKSDLSDRIFIKDQLAIKTNQLRIC